MGLGAELNAIELHLGRGCCTLLAGLASLPMRRSLIHFVFVAFYTLFFSVVLPVHDHSWLRICDDDDGCEALVPPAPPAKDDAPAHHDDCDGCAFCQFAARISHCTAPPPIVPNLLLLNYVSIARMPVHIPATPRRTSDPRGPPVA